jgi:hypothetical protein
MDEGDSTTRELMEAEAARQWAEQQRAQARTQFSTPSWIGPDRGTATTGHVPAQAEPEHDDIEVPVPAISGAGIPDTAHWAEKARPRIFAGFLLVLALIGVLASLGLTVATQSPVAISALAASSIVAVIFRGALMSAPITTIDLKGSVLTIRKGGSLDIVNLADPVHVVELSGTPDQATWRLRLEAVDGRVLEIGPAMVDAAAVHRIVEHYRKVADRARHEREERFRR